MEIDKHTYYSHGKLLITGEYVVLDGAKALAVPTKFGQQMTVEDYGGNTLLWESNDHTNNRWFTAEFSWDGFTFLTTNPTDIATRLIEILNTVQLLNSNFYELALGKKLITTLEFPANWGLGSSSTLINNIADYANVDAFKLLEKTFGGSGYDIACAQHDNAITFQLERPLIHIEPVFFRPIFHEQIFFVHLNKKQNSRDSISDYRATSKKDLHKSIQQISDISEGLYTTESLTDFEALIERHEALISEVIKTPTVKELLFDDYPNSIKSLGGWGGDFVMAIGDRKERDYFKNKGYTTILSFSDMIL